jgi:hypothetical protein
MKHEIRVKSLAIIKEMNVLTRIEFMSPYIPEATSNFRTISESTMVANTKAKLGKILVLLDIDM